MSEMRRVFRRKNFEHKTIFWCLKSSSETNNFLCIELSWKDFFCRRIFHSSWACDVIIFLYSNSVPPKITPFNFGDDIQEGMRVQVMCTSTQGDQPFNITWHRDGKALKIETSDSILSSYSNSNHLRQHHIFDERTIEINVMQSFSSILTIHNITSQHNGNYTCQISNPGGVVKYTAVLSVSGKGKRIWFSTFLHHLAQIVFFFPFITSMCVHTHAYLKLWEDEKFSNH